ncbi:hypothetical protein NL676_022419 [Syzygium grande]|nr:hypothetical protein NL676_022419 [Syzygium grande]
MARWSPSMSAPNPQSLSPLDPLPTRPSSATALSLLTAYCLSPPLAFSHPTSTSLAPPAYGPTWRLLHWNLMVGILRPSRLCSYSNARSWVLDILMAELKSQPSGIVRVFYKLFENWKCVLILLIRARSKAKREQLSKAKEDGNNGNGEWILSYVDTLLDLELLEEKRKLEEDEMVSLCSEFLIADTDTTTMMLQWILANLEDLRRMGYLKAVVLEGLRRHPPGHLVVLEN